MNERQNPNNAQEFVGSISLSHLNDLSTVSLNALRAFEAAARHLSFTQAAAELFVTQAAVSHQVKALEQQLGVSLFRRTRRGLIVTDEGLALLPTLSETFARLDRLIAEFEGGKHRAVLNVGVVGTFALGWLLSRTIRFEELHPHIDLRLATNNNKVDVAGESLDYAIRFGDGAWHGVEAERLLDAPLSPVCSPRLADRLREPADLRKTRLLRSYRAQDWRAWLKAAGVPDIPVRGPLFDASTLMAQAAILGHGVALVPAKMFERELTQRLLVRPFSTEVSTGAYWLTRAKSHEATPAMTTFRTWLLAELTP